ncbi:hypothetical protein BKA60DRAFT_549105 [Fusarium oxysporum]|nr:hypothetical protein BKA60DRAFT_549105 [Fusarium oxysporum]
MSDFTLSVIIDRDILKEQSTDKLVIACKVNGNLNAVFDGYAIKPTDPKWKKLVKPGQAVESSTDDIDIRVGYLTKYENNALTEQEKKNEGYFKKSGCFGVNSIPREYHVGVKMSTAGGKWITIYVNTDNHISTTNVILQPQNEYFLLWSSEVSTETIWALTETKGRKVIFKEGETAKKIRFGFATENSLTVDEKPDWY